MSYTMVLVFKKENDNEPPEIDDKSTEQLLCSERRAQMDRLRCLAENSAHPCIRSS